MRFIKRLTTSSLWFLVPALAVIAVLAVTFTSYQPLVFDPSLYENNAAFASDLNTIDADVLEAKNAKSKATESSDNDSAATSATAADASTMAQSGLTDGTYTGYAPCGQGNSDDWKPYYVAVTIRVEGGKVVSIESVKGSSTGASGSSPLSWDAAENQRYLDKAAEGANGVTSQIKHQLSAAGSVSGIDTVSGATYSSVAIYNAYLNAVSQAGGTSSASASSQPLAPSPKTTSTSAKANKKPVKTKVKAKASKKLRAKGLANGSWTGYAICGQGNDMDWKPYYVAVTVKVKGGKLVGITAAVGSSTGEKGAKRLNWDAAENGTYMDWARDGRTRSGVTYQGVLAQIAASIAKGSVPASVDTVSGATYSSEAIFDAFYAAVRKAAAASGVTVKKPSNGGSQTGSQTGTGGTSSSGGTGNSGGSGSTDGAGDSSGTGGNPGSGGTSGESGDSGDSGGSGESGDAGDSGGESDNPKAATLIDGTYSGHAFCRDNDNPREWSPYYIIVDIVVQNGRIASVSNVYGDSAGTIDSRYKYNSSENATYLNFAINGVGRRIAGMKAKIQAKLDAHEEITDIDTVSSATWSSRAILEAYKNAAAAAQDAADAAAQTVSDPAAV